MLNMSKKYLLRELKTMVIKGEAVNITRAGVPEYEAIKAREGYLTVIGHSEGVYGLSGLLIQGENTKTLYAITARSTALYIFY